MPTKPITKRGTMHTVYIDREAQPDVYDSEEIEVVFPEETDPDAPPLDPTAPEVWANSAGIRIKDNAVQVWVSTGDLRGAFQMELRRAPDGRIYIHTPHPDEGMPHEETEHLHPGTLVITRTKPREDTNHATN
jgi:hypothetical protein